MSNRLTNQTSPYLKAHADNPVDWQPWDDQALAEAREAGKPILLSIGYSACHWCHVMAHESFEDQATARVMNQHFVNIKVDREERPDLDKVYQLAHQLLTQQSGGWPLTAFLDPETLLPFFAGTYFPRSPRHQLPGFTDLLLRISETFGAQRDALAEQGEKISTVLNSLNNALDGTTDDQPVKDLIDSAHEALAAQYDPVEGGFGRAPKFPMPSTVRRELDYWAYAAGDSGARSSSAARASLDRVMTTLTRVARGGIHDHIGGGFFRYATDRKWMIPHFEKMLYDNGQLLGLYADALALGPDALFKDAVTNSAEWLLREMRHPQGGFYAALDADSEGEEGRFYLWRRDEAKKCLTEPEYLVVETLYGLDKPANFEGRWNLHRHDAWRSVVERLSLPRDEADATLASARQKLFAARSGRPAPGLDDKVLTSWNGLAVTGLARAGLQFGRADWIDAASGCMDFLRDAVWNGERLFATWQAGQPRHPGYLDDHANLLMALVSLLAARWREADAAFALALTEATLANFFDNERGGFFFTAHDHESLIYRPKPTMDDAQPPGNGVMAEVLIRLGHLFGEPRYLEAAERTLAWARPQMQRYPAGHCSLLSALALLESGTEQIILRGPTPLTPEWLEVARRGYKPWRMAFAIPYDGVTTLPAYLPRLVSSEARNRITGYHCSGFSCSPPIESLEALSAALG